MVSLSQSIGKALISSPVTLPSMKIVPIVPSLLSATSSFVDGADMVVEP
jgi:hypothetical protein